MQWMLFEIVFVFVVVQNFHPRTNPYLDFYIFIKIIFSYRGYQNRLNWENIKIHSWVMFCLLSGDGLDAFDALPIGLLPWYTSCGQFISDCSESEALPVQELFSILVEFLRRFSIEWMVVILSLLFSMFSKQPKCLFTEPRWVAAEYYKCCR